MTAQAHRAAPEGDVAASDFVTPVRRERPPWVTAAAVGAVFVAVFLLTSTYERHLATLIMSYAIAVLGLDLIVGRTGLLSFGQSAFLAIGAYIAVILIDRAGMPFLLASMIAVLVAGLAGAIFTLPASRLTGLAFAFTTFGVGFVVDALLAGTMLSEWTNGANGLFTPVTTVLGMRLEGGTLYYAALILLLACILIYGNLVTSRSGRALSTLKESEAVALGLGIPVQRYKMWSFAVGAAFAGVSGILLAFVTEYVAPDSFTLETSITLMAMLILGGTSSLVGPLIGAAFFVLLPEYLHGVEDNAPMVFAAILLVTLIVAPQGVMGIVRAIGRRWRERPAG